MVDHSDLDTSDVSLNSNAVSKGSENTNVSNGCVCEKFKINYLSNAISGKNML